MLANPAAPTSIEAESRVPLFVTFKEHYCIDSRQVLPNPEPVDGIKHAWLPERFFWSSRGVSHSHLHPPSRQTIYVGLTVLL
jgi:hypothetical protein